MPPILGGTRGRVNTHPGLAACVGSAGSAGAPIQRDTLAKGKAFEVPLIRLGFPLFDRHHLHRQTTWGYEGAMNIVTTLVNAVLEKLDSDTSQLGKTDYSFDLVR